MSLITSDALESVFQWSSVTTQPRQSSVFAPLNSANKPKTSDRSASISASNADYRTNSKYHEVNFGNVQVRTYYSLLIVSWAPFTHVKHSHIYAISIVWCMHATLFSAPVSFMFFFKYKAHPNGCLALHHITLIMRQCTLAGPVYTGMPLEYHWLTQCTLGYHWVTQRELAGYTGTLLDKNLF